jgi:hypothetical protein
VLVVSLALGTGLGVGVRRASGQPSAPPLPRGSIALADGTFRSGRGFRATVEHVARELARRGIACDPIGPYRRRGVLVARFVVRAAKAPWRAVHVWDQGGKTFVAIVASPAVVAP